MRNALLTAVGISAAGFLCADPVSPFYSRAGGYVGSGSFAMLTASSSTSSQPDYGYRSPFCWGGIQIDGTTDCLVASNINMVALNAESPFIGRSLQIGVSDNYSVKDNKGALYAYFREEANAFAIEKDLILVNARILFKYYYDSVIRAEKISVWTPVESPVTIENASSSSSVKFGAISLDAPIEGAADVGMKVINTKVGYDFGVKLRGDMSKYYGKLTVEPTSLGSGEWTRTTLYVTNTTVGGTISLAAGARLSPLVAGEGFSVETLEILGDRPLLALALDPTSRTSGGICVTRPVTCPENVKILVSISCAEGQSAEALDVPVLTVPLASDLEEEDFELVQDSENAVSCSQGLKMRPDANGTTKTLYALCDADVTMILTDSSDRVGEHASALTNQTAGGVSPNWSDECAVHARANYLIQGVKGGSMCLRTYDAKPCAAGNVPSLDYVFPGVSISFAQYSELLILGHSFECENIRFVGNASINSSIYGPTELRGRITVAPDVNVSSLLYNESTLQIAAQVSGAGSFTLSGHSGANTANPSATFYFSNVNTGFTGSVTVSIRQGTKNGLAERLTPQFDPALKKFSTLCVNNGQALGGPTDPANPKAVTIENMCRLSLRDAKAVVFDEPTRGFFIRWVGRFYVAAADETLTIKSPVAVYGTLHKEGEGLLVLGNPQPTFGATALATEPDADSTNRMFVVDGGRVQISSARALNGLDIVSAGEQALFLLEANPSDSELAEYGLIDILTPGTPFSVSGSATKVRFAVTAQTKPAWESKQVALCTVRRSLRDSVAGVLARAKVQNAGKVSIRAVTPVDTVVDGVECVTFQATAVSNQGLVVVLR